MNGTTIALSENLDTLLDRAHQHLGLTQMTSDNDNPDDGGQKQRKSLLGRVIRRLLVLSIIAFLSMYLMAAMAQTPDLGVQNNGKLAPCPDSPNCVSTFATDSEHAMESIKFQIAATNVTDVIEEVLASHPRTEIIGKTEAYVRAEVKSLIFRFVDDVEFLVDDTEQIIHFRSASRVGYSDMGANRSRMTKLSAKIDDKLRELESAN